MSVAKLNSFEKKQQNATITVGDVNSTLIPWVKDGGGASKAEKSKLAGMLASDKFSPAAKKALEDFLKGLGGDAVKPMPRSGPVIRAVMGSDLASFADDSVILGKNGTLNLNTGIDPYTRSYDSIQGCVLKTVHGSVAPASTAINATDLAKLQKEAPGDSLNEAASAFKPQARLRPNGDLEELLRQESAKLGRQVPRLDLEYAIENHRQDGRRRRSQRPARALDRRPLDVARGSRRLDDGGG